MSTNSRAKALENKTRHTPGPWKAVISNDFNGAVRVEVEALNGDRIISDGFNRTREGHLIPQAEADAHLIAAAPELLAALEAVLPHLPGYVQQDHAGRPWLIKAMDAVTRARYGRGVGGSQK